jgi:hypothetical protein
MPQSEAGKCLVANTYSTYFTKRAGYSFDRETVLDLFRIVQKFLEKDPEVAIDLDGDHKIASDDPNDL